MTDLKSQILLLREEGKTYAEIMEKLGCAKSTVSYYCGSNQAEKSLVRQRNRVNKIRLFVQQEKQSRGCEECGEKYPYWVLEFDHVRGEKIGNISRMVSSKEYSLEDIQTEIDKCDVVCANCHKNRTWNRLVKSGADVLDTADFY